MQTKKRKFPLQQRNTSFYLYILQEIKSFRFLKIRFFVKKSSCQFYDNRGTLFAGIFRISDQEDWRNPPGSNTSVVGFSIFSFRACSHFHLTTRTANVITKRRTATSSAQMTGLSGSHPDNFFFFRFLSSRMAPFSYHVKAASFSATGNYSARRLRSRSNFVSADDHCEKTEKKGKKKGRRRRGTNTKERKRRKMERTGWRGWWRRDLPLWSQS